MGNIDSKGELIPSVPKNRDKPCLRFGKFTLDPARRGLYVGANRVRLTSKPFELLVVLVEGRGQTVEKQQLLDAVWKDAFVTEDSLVKAVREIRRALDDNKGNPQFVQTVPGEGYRFIADVTVVKFNPDTRAEDLQGAESVTSEEVIERPSGKAPTTIQSRQLWNVGVAIVAFLAIALGFSLKRPSDEEPPRQDPIATFSAPYTSISVSPDGSWITFIADSDGVPQVWVKNLSGGEPFAITSGDIPSSGPRWSPKNNEIVFTRGEEAPSIWSVPPVPGQGPTLLIQAGRNPRWNTTGDRLVFERADEIWTAHADGTHQLRVEGVPEVDFLIVDRDPSFSPDGSQIAFFQPEDGPMGDIWIVPAGGGKARQLTFDNHLGGSPVWTPKGDYIVFTSQRRGSKTLWKIPSSGG
jgi:DNA-binding winged helix-turn-helix (wHTH) protein